MTPEQEAKIKKDILENVGWLNSEGNRQELSDGSISTIMAVIRVNLEGK